ncbi:hypothetical protein GCM10009682_37330 [Luedemannella flava]|uniref:Lipoprotein n=1 Tax=Luedemannella flava TaxID=349316 RepID=A0ABN2M7A4_9ACTN
MVRTRRLITVALTTLLLAPLAACAVEPKEWAGTVCASLTPWRKQIAELNAKAQQQMANAKTPTDTQKNLVALLGGARDASETARRAVEEAGEPDVDQGEVIARRFVDSLAAVRDAYGHAKGDIEKLSTKDDQDFYDGVVDIITTLNQEYASSRLDTSAITSPELSKAFDEIPECR